MESIKEQDLFKFLLMREEAGVDERARVLRNVTMFKAKLPRNIFRNEYYVLYEAITKAKMYNTVLTFDQFQEIVIQQIPKLVERPEVDPEEFMDEDVSDVMAVRETLLDLVITTYDELLVLDIEDDSEFGLNIDLYVRAFVQEKLKEVITTMYEIAGSGKRFGREFKQGTEDAHEYYSEQYAKLVSLITEDVKTLANVVRTDTMTTQDLKDLKSSGALHRPVSHTGIESIDEHINDFRVGDMVAVMGQPGAGKTRMSVNIMYNGLKRGNNVLWYPLEGNAMQAFSLMLARHILEVFADRIELDDRRLYDESYPVEMAETVDLALLDFFTNPSYGKVAIKNLALYDDEVMLDLENEFDSGFHFDILCIDYVSLIMNKKGEMKAAYLSRLIQQLKANAMTFKNHGYMLLLPHQLTKEVIKDLMAGNDTTITGSADTSEVVKSADLAMALFRDEEQAAKDLINVILTKTRFARKTEPVEVMALHGKCYFADKLDV